jgi:hypothetical protein
MLATNVRPPHDHKHNPTYKESNFSISAWEYAAPTMRPDPWPVGDVTFLFDVELRLSRGGGLQKGDAELVGRASAGELSGCGRPRQIIHTLTDLFNSNWTCISMKPPYFKLLSEHTNLDHLLRQWGC